MRFPSIHKNKVISAIISASLGTLFAGAICLQAPSASADNFRVDSDGKGITGCALLGGEIGLVTLSVFKVKEDWAYYTIPPVLAIGGGIGGYFIDTQVKSPELSIALMAGGMALVIPTIVITLNSLQYDNGAQSEDSAPSSAKPAPKPDDNGTTTTPPPASTDQPKPTSRARTLDFALVNVNDEARVHFAVPLVTMRPMYSQSEIQQFGVRQMYDWHAPILSVRF